MDGRRRQRETYSEAMVRENELEGFLLMCIPQIHSQLRTPAGATREEAELRRARLLELVREFEKEVDEVQRPGGRLIEQEVHCGERYGYLFMVIEGVRQVYFIQQ
ncbi:uncharacterized protein BKCO1_1000073 [Diplodia corticola]|uniref:Uncharacterized protein n=1 Tax=Diplodia corticola TaxID=236234 RepID=A0A1J9S858_9PEZI|nr:uncharacterized protein BKCO1_1000073 [Diplodia corticola]OJD36679.1 hypothetical protein BKCO1_1000073 [Diplodia corticola]